MSKLIDNVASADHRETPKIKTHCAKIIVGGHVEKPCYSILWFDYADKEFHIGYSSYRLDYVRIWLEEEFEIIDAPMNLAEVVHCRECQHSIDDAWPAGKVWCRKICRYMKEDGFCSLGERRNNG